MTITREPVGAVILAAGCSSRMGDFKPLLKIGEHTMIEHVLHKFLVAKCSPIVIVTGREAELLEQEVRKQHSENQNIYFICNTNYKTTQMLDSARLGMQYLQALQACDAFFFTTVDIPLFAQDTLERLQNGEGRLRKPSYHMQGGHPIYIHTSLIQSIVNYTGDKGLKGAFSQIGEMQYIDVEDEGILMDADTKESLEQLRVYADTKEFSKKY